MFFLSIQCAFFVNLIIVNDSVRFQEHENLLLSVPFTSNLEVGLFFNQIYFQGFKIIIGYG